MKLLDNFHLSFTSLSISLFTALLSHGKEKSNSSFFNQTLGNMFLDSFHFCSHFSEYFDIIGHQG